MLTTILDSLAVPIYQVIFVVSAALLTIGLVEVLFVKKTVRRLLARIKLDSTTLSLIRRPIYLQILVWSVVWSLHKLVPNSSMAAMCISAMYTSAVLFWAMTLSQIGTRILLRLSRMVNYAQFIDQQTVGVFLIAYRVVIWSFAIYLCFFTWDVDLTGWLASAGVIGIVLGFAAKDTLANLVAGLAILADHSYQVGDYIEVESSHRGRVVRIGMRATIIHTVQDIQIAIPNSLLSNGYVVNETAGTAKSHRIEIPVSVAYGTNLDDAVKCLLDATKALPHVARPQDTKVLVSELGDSGVYLKVLIWLEDPKYREILIDMVLKAAYRAFNESGIVIPFNQLDVNVKS
jgi:MscS family membrane protein